MPLIERIAVSTIMGFNCGTVTYQTMSMAHYLYEVSFQKNPNFGYAAAISYVILMLVAILSFIQMKVGDKRD